jgi:hypothetical protein
MKKLCKSGGLIPNSVNVRSAAHRNLKKFKLRYMKGYLILDGEKLGIVDFAVVDESMGGIGGDLQAYPAYEKFRKQIQLLCGTKGIANINDLAFVIMLEENILIEPEGGIGITDVEGFDVYVESAGIQYDIINMILSNK